MKPRYPLSKSFAALLIFVLLPSVASAQMPQFDSLYVFGDSLADNGNVLIQSEFLGAQPPVPPRPTYFNGRFSNGYIGFEYLWQRLTGTPLDGPGALKPFLAAPLVRRAAAIDFAYGGTGTAYVDQTPGGMWAPGLKGQVELFRFALRGKKPSNRALYAIATGSNDYRLDAFNQPMAPEQVVGNIEEAIVSLYRLGARNVMVLDMPNLAMLPFADPAASGISSAHNDLLYPMLANLQARLPKLHLITIELEPLFAILRGTMEWQVPALMALFPPPPGMALCLFVNPATCQDASTVFNVPMGLLFWDVVHPTTEAYYYLGDYLHTQLEASYD
jgi:phospholipase/lecithinase/hemolysin